MDADACESHGPSGRKAIRAVRAPYTGRQRKRDQSGERPDKCSWEPPPDVVVAGVPVDWWCAAELVRRRAKLKGGRAAMIP